MPYRILLLVIVVGLISIGVGCSRFTQSPNSAGVEVTPQLVEKHLSAFRPIEGTSYMIADISGNPQTEARGSFSPFRWIESGYSGYSGYEIYNYVFFSSEPETFNRLLPTNEYVVLQIVGFPSGTPTEKPEDFKPVRWWLYVLAKADTDKSGILDYEDKLTIGVTDVGGNNPIEVIPDADSVLGHILKDDDVLFVIYHSLDKNYIAKIDLPGRQVVSTTEMNLGDDVK
ncbi:MAG TPA: hypothetical protein VN843_15355 [Anaerolineales bacterium]|nr:hypothetical protein [Anaerolineales bacterium]